MPGGGGAQHLVPGGQHDDVTDAIRGELEPLAGLLRGNRHFNARYHLDEVDHGLPLACIDVDGGERASAP